MICERPDFLNREQTENSEGKILPRVRNPWGWHCNLIQRTRLKLAASMLHFQEWADFADYFGSRWHYYLVFN